MSRSTNRKLAIIKSKSSILNCYRNLLNYIRKVRQTPSRVSLSDNKISEINRNLSLSYIADYGVHEIDLLLGAEQTIFEADSMSASREQFYSNAVSELPLGNPDTRENFSASPKWKLQSLFGRLNYALLNKYILEASFRYDGSSRFAKNNRYGFFPSLSASYVISDEKFMESFDFVNELKIRASWGQLGNQNIDLYQYLPSVSLDQVYSFGGNLVNGAARTDLANQNITWETTTSTNIGLDAEIFNGQFAFTIDLFKKRTEDILLNVPIPYTFGINAPTQNAGIVDNKGFELEVRHNNQLNNALSYNISANFSHIINQVVSLADTGPIFVEGGDDRIVLQEGEAFNSLYGYEAEGLFRSQEEIENHALISPQTKLGFVKYKDQNGDGRITEEDKVILGNTIPEYTYSIDLFVNYKRFSLNTFWQGVIDAYTMPNGGMIDGPYWGSFINTNWLDRWTPENPDGSYPSVYYQQSGPNTESSTNWLQNTSYIRLKSLTIGYNVPSGFLGFKDARLYLAGTNLLTFTPSDNFVDPEIRSGRLNAYPQTKSYSIGLEFSF